MDLIEKIIERYKHFPNWTLQYIAIDLDVNFSKVMKALQDYRGEAHRETVYSILANVSDCPENRFSISKASLQNRQMHNRNKGKRPLVSMRYYFDAIVEAANQGSSYCLIRRPSCDVDACEVMTQLCHLNPRIVGHQILVSWEDV